MKTFFQKLYTEFQNLWRVGVLLILSGLISAIADQYHFPVIAGIFYFLSIIFTIAIFIA